MGGRHLFLRGWTTVEHNNLFKTSVDVLYQRIRKCQRTGRLGEPRDMKLDPASGDRVAGGAHLIFQGGMTVTQAEAGRHFRLKGQWV